MPIRPTSQSRNGIFLSSTSDPVVKEYRLAARQVIEGDEFRDKWYAIEMDSFPAGKPPAELCKSKVLECMVYIGILGPIYGSICQSVGVSYVEFEYQVALDANREMGIFLLPLELLKQESYDTIVNQAPLHDRQEAFRKRVRVHVAPTVSSIEDFKTQLSRFLRSLPTQSDLASGKASALPSVQNHDTSSFDKHILDGYHFNDLDQQQLKRFLESDSVAQELSRLDLLRSSIDAQMQGLGLTTPYGLRQGTFLCFAPRNLIASAVSAAGLYMRVYDGVDRAASNTLYRREASDNLTRLFEVGMDFFHTQLERIDKPSSKDLSDLEIPKIALHEALANALIHREYEHEYARNQPTRLEIYKDRVEITSYGGLIGDVSEKQLNIAPEQITAYRRNHIITQIFMHLTLADFGGGGVARIYHFTRLAGLPRPRIIEKRGKPGSVRVTLYRRSAPSLTIQASVSTTTRAPDDVQLLPLPEYFVGRVDELAWVISRLRRGTSIGITALGGMGGIGKTALAAIATRALRQEDLFRDGIAVALCMGHTEADEILQLVVDRFAAERNPDTGEHVDSVDSLVAFLLGKDVLIVLDNIEPDLDLERVVTPLRTAGAVLLLTARQKMTGAVVPSSGWRELDRLPHDDALDLFAHSAGYRSLSDLGVDVSTAERIVNALQNHTLAIRLAGAAVVGGPVNMSALAEELEHDPLTLRSGHSARYIEHVLQSSIDSLTPGARKLFIALSAFATEEWGRKAATDVARSLHIKSPAQATHQLIERNLVDVSLLPDPLRQANQQRLRMHPLLRALSARLFAQWSMTDQVATKEAVALFFTTHVQKVTELELSADPLNIAGALEWACEHRKDAITVALCSAMEAFWNHRWLTKASVHFLPLGIQAADRIATSTGLAQDRLRAADLALAYARILRRIGDLKAAESALHLNLAVRRALRDRDGEGAVLSQLGLTTRAVGQTQEAQDFLEESVSIRRELRDERGEAEDLSVLARLARTRGDLTRAREGFERSIAIFSKVGDRRNEGVNLGYLAQIPIMEGNLAEAEQLAHDGLEIAREVANKRGEAESLSILGQIARARGRLDDAEDYLKQSLAIRHEVLDKRGQGADLGLLGRIAQSRGQLHEAHRLFQQSLNIALQVSDQRGEAAVLSSLGQLELARGSHEDAETHFLQSLSLRRKVQDLQGESVDLSQLGRLNLNRGNFSEAERFLMQSLTIDRDMFDRPGEGVDLSQLALVALEQKQYEEANAYLQKSFAIRQAVQDRRGEGVDLALLGRIALEQGSLDEAESYFQRSLDLAQRVQNRRGEGVSLRKMATIAETRGDIQHAEQLYRSSLVVSIEVENGLDHAESLAELGRFLIEHRRAVEEGCQKLQESVLMYRRMKIPGEDRIQELMRRLGCLN